MAVVISVLAQRVSVSMACVVWSLYLATPIQAKPICQDGFYYDDVTGNCDHCSDICDQAREQGTVEKCLRLCPDFKLKTTQPNCTSLQYYDSVVNRCEPCASVCPGGGVSASELSNECRELCPDWQGVIPVTVGYDSETEGHTHSAMTLEPNPHIYIIIGIAIPLMIAVIIVVLLIVWKYSGNNNKDVPGTPCTKRPQQRVQRESHEMESLTGRGDPLSHPEGEEG